MSKTNDAAYMRRALRLARQGRGWTNPNPMVGAVVVKNGCVVGEGYHRAFGKPHAETEALRRAGNSSKGATLYVTLEPCLHWGRTPPCVPAIKAAGVKRVVFASSDPVAAHGGGAAMLRKARIKVTGGVMRKEADELNEAFMTLHRKRRPFVALKFAASLDGKLATRSGDSKWITNERARACGRSLRGTYQAVVVGSNTALRDDPHLGARAPRARDPLRVILDSRLRIPLNAKVLRDTNVLIATTARSPSKKRAALEKRGIPLHVFKGSRVFARDLLACLAKKGIVSVLVEGGGEVIGSFLDARLADKVYVAHAPLVIGGTSAIQVGGRGAATIKRSLRLRDVSHVAFGDNMMTIGYVSTASL